jgi:hypothetical protein
MLADLVVGVSLVLSSLILGAVIVGTVALGLKERGR